MALFVQPLEFSALLLARAAWGAHSKSPCWPDTVSPGGAVPTSLHGLTEHRGWSTGNSWSGNSDGTREELQSYGGTNGNGKAQVSRWYLGELEVQNPGWVISLTYSFLRASFLCSKMAHCGHPINPTGIPDLPPLTLAQPNLPWDLRGRTEAHVSLGRGLRTLSAGCSLLLFVPWIPSSLALSLSTGWGSGLESLSIPLPSTPSADGKSP